MVGADSRQGRAYMRWPPCQALSYVHLFVKTVFDSGNGAAFPTKATDLGYLDLTNAMPRGVRLLTRWKSRPRSVNKQKKKTKALGKKKLNFLAGEFYNGFWDSLARKSV